MWKSLEITLTIPLRKQPPKKMLPLSAKYFQKIKLFGISKNIIPLQQTGLVKILPK